MTSTLERTGHLESIQEPTTIELPYRWKREDYATIRRRRETQPKREMMR